MSSSFDPRGTKSSLYVDLVGEIEQLSVLANILGPSSPAIWILCEMRSFTIGPTLYSDLGQQLHGLSSELVTSLKYEELLLHLLMANSCLRSILLASSKAGRRRTAQSF